MTHLLHIDSSPRSDRSHTRRLTAEFVQRWRDTHPGGTVTYRDIGRNPLPHVTESWIAAAFTPPKHRNESMQLALRLSDELVDEFLQADLIVAGIPFYNFGMPSGFKAYVDQIVRVGRTFAFDPANRVSPYTPLVHGKRMIAVISRGDGGYGPGGRNQHHNHLDSHLATVLQFIGVNQLEIVAAENDEYGGTDLLNSLESARRTLRGFALEETSQSKEAVGSNEAR
ncbi:acyl carrier protein phosphodiesterase [Rhodopirellula maiorica SM1]|uniref:FMN dependent NADH:quinone oxidoreductase n=1 Tax=Rhodopirellula maiorica SM1 TaxID=1265738 RepID=M5S5Q1_9BACT|nr:NAD(P)H-dependent oxidoreductase [Rhodopirellula maiorica]EMI22987.1 acyl carrier protein phosphodiesterase [Rhodopirellula maiorica SM1]